MPTSGSVADATLEPNAAVASATPARMANAPAIIFIANPHSACIQRARLPVNPQTDDITELLCGTALSPMYLWPDTSPMGKLDASRCRTLDSECRHTAVAIEADAQRNSDLVRSARSWRLTAIIDAPDSPAVCHIPDISEDRSLTFLMQAMCAALHSAADWPQRAGDRQSLHPRSSSHRYSRSLQSELISLHVTRPARRTSLSGPLDGLRTSVRRWRAGQISDKLGVAAPVVP